MYVLSLSLNNSNSVSSHLMTSSTISRGCHVRTVAFSFGCQPTSAFASESQHPSMYSFIVTDMPRSSAERPHTSDNERRSSRESQ